MRTTDDDSTFCGSYWGDSVVPQAKIVMLQETLEMNANAFAFSRCRSPWVQALCLAIYLIKLKQAYLLGL